MRPVTPSMPVALADECPGAAAGFGRVNDHAPPFNVLLLVLRVVCWGCRLFRVTLTRVRARLKPAHTALGPGLLPSRTDNSVVSGDTSTVCPNNSVGVPRIVLIQANV